MSFGGWSISEELYGWLVEHVPPGKTVLELGSGAGTAELVKRWTVFSVEHDLKWVGQTEDSHYTHAPLVDGWYDRGIVEALERNVSYDVLIIDGPPGLSRGNFLQHMDLFDESVPWVFDDLHRQADLRAAAKVASARGCALEVHRCADGKEFGVISPDHRLPT